MTRDRHAGGRLGSQPRAVWAGAFAAVVSFMGLGLVDPICRRSPRAGAVVLYEAALGLGISVGPLLGGELGGISWRGPFFGVAALMSIGFVAIRLLLPRTPPPPKSERISVVEPLRALRRRATSGGGL